MRRALVVRGGGPWLAAVLLGLLPGAESGHLVVTVGTLAGLTVIGAAAVAYYVRSTWLEADDGDLRISKWGRERKVGSAEIRGLACREVRGLAPQPRRVVVILANGQIEEYAAGQ